MAVITISREIYSDGNHIGEKVAEALGYHFTDKKTIEKVFGAQHLSVQRGVRHSAWLLGTIRRYEVNDDEVPKTGHPGPRPSR
jgi:hypothetical protein